MGSSKERHLVPQGRVFGWDAKLPAPHTPGVLLLLRQQLRLTGFGTSNAPLARLKLRKP